MLALLNMQPGNRQSFGCLCAQLRVTGEEKGIIVIQICCTQVLSLMHGIYMQNKIKSLIFIQLHGQESLNHNQEYAASFKKHAFRSENNESPVCQKSKD